MKGVVFIIILLIAAAIVILLLAVKLKAVVRIEQNHIKATLIILWVIRLNWHFVLLRDKSSIIKVIQKEKDGTEKTILTLAELICRLERKKQTKKERARGVGFGHAYKKMHIDIRASVKIGLGDAFSTAMLCGALQTGFGIAERIGKPKHHRLRLFVRPDFSKPAYCFLADCIIKLSPVHIIVGYIIYLKNLRR